MARVPSRISRNLLIAHCPSLALGLAVFSMTASTRADFEFQQSIGNYGTLDQNAPGIDNGPVACAPTATVNSFTFLENEYDLTGLIDETPVQTVNDLEAANYMDVTPNSGASATDVIEGKMAWINNQGLGNKIRIEGQAGGTFGGSAIDQQLDSDLTTAGDIVGDHEAPTAQFIYDQLAAGQDVEMGFLWWDGTDYVGGHVVTATGIDWDTTTETGTISFIDPWGAADIFGATLEMHDGFLELTYAGGAAGGGLGADGNTPTVGDPDNPDDERTADIAFAYAESPVPEPASMGLLCVGAVGLLRRRSRR
jgi:hypothetical protein